jgi:hypothetical protein
MDEFKRLIAQSYSLDNLRREADLARQMRQARPTGGGRPALVVLFLIVSLLAWLIR